MEKIEVGRIGNIPVMKYEDAICENFIFVTNKYKQFSFLEGNRDINDSHVNALMKSMQKKYLFTVLLSTI